MTDSATIALVAELISRPSVTPDDAGCQKLLAERLAALGFEIEWFIFNDTTNLWARRGHNKPLFCFAGHTDVVPPGPLDAWTTDPFTPAIRDGYLYGRGAADMKGGVAAMVVAAEEFVRQHPHHQGSIAFLLTSDEEGNAVDGTQRVIEALVARNEIPDYCVVGEPSSSERLGDTIKIGRRGSITGKLRVKGIQGHVAYPEKGRNPFHSAAQALLSLTTECWDEGNEAFPPTSFQMTDLTMGTGADNVIPPELHARFNLRFSTELTAEKIQARVKTILDNANLDYELSWRVSGKPFLTQSAELVQAFDEAIFSHCGIKPAHSTSGGTSDARFIAPTGAQVMEFGVLNDTCHQIDEHVAVEDLNGATQIFIKVLERLLS